VTVTETDVEDRNEPGGWSIGSAQAVRGAGPRGPAAVLSVALTDDLVRGLKAGDLVTDRRPQWRGGGRPHFASAGAGDPSRLDEAERRFRASLAGWAVMAQPFLAAVRSEGAGSLRERAPAYLMSATADCGALGGAGSGAPRDLASFGSPAALDLSPPTPP
jgi:hypothetical protein